MCFQNQLRKSQNHEAEKQKLMRNISVELQTQTATFKIQSKGNQTGPKFTKKSNQTIDRTRRPEHQSNHSNIDKKRGRKFHDLIDLIPPVEVLLEPIPHDVVHQRRIEKHPGADTHRRALRVDGHPHHHSPLALRRVAILATRQQQLILPALSTSSSTRIARKLLDSHRSAINTTQPDPIGAPEKSLRKENPQSRSVWGKRAARIGGRNPI